MTSPAQLKYLEAMGIPVWVSRDLVIDAEISIESVISTSERESISDKAFSKPINKNERSAALSLLDSLEEGTLRSTVTNQNTTGEVPTNKAPVSSIDKQQPINQTHSDESSSATSVIAKSPNTKNDGNLLLKSNQYDVYAAGSESASWMVIGHSPEPYSGIGLEPFAGDAGELLDNMLRAVGIEQPRFQAYLLNVVDTNQSVDSNDDELQTNQTKTLSQDLLAVIEKIKPQVILFVGQIAAQNLLESEDPLIIMRSKVHKVSVSNIHIPCVVTYYPNYLLEKPVDKRKAWDDLKLAMRQLPNLH